MKKIIYLLVSVIALGGIAYACSCILPENPEIEFSKFDAVFTGKAIQIEQSKKHGYDVKFRVSKSYKGDLDEIVLVHTGFGGGDCGYPFVENEEYLVYANSYKDGLFAGICSRTRRLSDAKEDLEVLEAIK